MAIKKYRGDVKKRIKIDLVAQQHACAAVQRDHSTALAINPEMPPDPHQKVALMQVRLAEFSNQKFFRGRSLLVELLWLLVQAALVSSWLPGSRHRCFLFRMFGARIGKGVNIKPGVRVKFPWRLDIGDYTWIGEDVWIDNLVQVQVGANCCLSQGAYLCTGNHDWTKREFDLVVGSIQIHDGAWIAARASVGPGVTVGEGAVLCLGSVATKNLAPWTINLGVPASVVGSRRVGTACSHIPDGGRAGPYR